MGVTTGGAPGIGVAVGVGTILGVGVGTGVAVDAGVAVGTGVDVGVTEGVGVIEGVGCIANKPFSESVSEVPPHETIPTVNVAKKILRGSGTQFLLPKRVKPPF